MAATLFDLQYFFIAFLLWLFSAIFFFRKTKKSPQNICLPPSPRALPLIGHLHLLLSAKPYERFEKLSSKYGPIIYLRVFNTPICLVSSASVIYDVYKTQDSKLSSQSTVGYADSIIVGPHSFFMAPYGDYWKFMKKLAMTKFLGPQALEKSRGVRGEEMERLYLKLLDKARMNEAVDLDEETRRLMNDIVCRILIGRRFSDETNEEEQVTEMVKSTFFAFKMLFLSLVLHPLKRSRILEKEVMKLSRRYDVLLERFLREHEENPRKGNKDMIDTLLEACRDENAQYKITRNNVKSFIVDIFLGAIHNAGKAVQWTMGELINHPNILKKARDEINFVVGETRLPRETDLPNLPYLQAIVKEGLRLHSPAPIISRMCTESCKVADFDVPKDTFVITNLYGIMKDPSVWENANEFRLERFLVPLEDQEEPLLPKYVPFGGGRRACPGERLAYLSVGTALATLVQCFDWRIDGDKVNMEETGDVTLSMVHPLKCTPLLRFDPLAS